MAGGTTGVDQATIAFRRLLSDAGSGEQTRVDALVVLSQRTVFAATWPGQNQAIRTLTNSTGETAMPLFSGRDVLEETAARFGWLNPDGTLSFRELPAREALRHALGRGVHFVVLDIGSDHAVEFAREEIEPLLLIGSSQQGTGAFASAGEPQAAILDAVRRSTRPPPMAAMPVTARGGRAAAVEIDMPFADVKTGGKLPVQRGLSQPMPQRTQAGQASQPMPQRTQAGQASQPMPQRTQAAQPPSAARPRAASQPIMPAMRMPSSAPPGPASAAAQRTAALEVAAALTSAARGAGDPEAQKAAEDLSRMLMNEAVESELRPLEEKKLAAKRMAALLTGQPMPDEPEESDRESGEQVRQPGEAPSLPDALLQAMSQALRSFPEVEWACVQADADSELAVIGVRVDPSFLNRVADITDAIFAAAEKHSQQLQVLLLNNTELVKLARKNGKAFYPWKR